MKSAFYLRKILVSPCKMFCVDSKMRMKSLYVLVKTNLISFEAWVHAAKIRGGLCG